MAKKPSSSSSKPAAKSAKPAAKEVKPVAKAATTVRNTSIPKPSSKPAPRVSTPKPELTHALIAERAYFISQSGTGGSEYDNWCRAEFELRNELGL